MNYGFLINNKKCIGCHACSTACKSENQVPLGVFRTWVKYTEVGLYPNTRRNFQVTRCNHCENPPCVDICPVEAMHQRDDGIVGYNQDKCIGCSSCVQACPYDSIYIDPEDNTAKKCHYCAHRVENGMEPACVVVCPEHAIVSGDLDDPESEISLQIAKNNITVRKPEQGTAPKLFYVDGHEAALTPTVTQAKSKHFIWADVVGEKNLTAEEEAHNPLYVGNSEHMVQTTLNAQHKVQWHWQVPAYLVSKGIASGAFMLIAFAFAFGLAHLDGPSIFATGVSSLIFGSLTLLFLVMDLKRPERFIRVLTMGQPKSWLVKGGLILNAFMAVVSASVVFEFGGILGAIDMATVEQARPVILFLGIPAGVAAAIYTAYLLGQAQGRDLWQSSLLPFHFLVQALMGGAAFMMLLSAVAPLSASLASILPTVFMATLVVDLGMILLGEFGMKHTTDNAHAAAEMILKGQFKNTFWMGAIVLGHLVPIAILLSGIAPLAALASLATLIGLYAYEHVFVTAPQMVPNS